MNKLFAILIMCSLSLPVLGAEEMNELGTNRVDEQHIEAVTEIEDIQKPEAPELNENLKPVPVVLPSRYKEPMSKKKLAKKFIIAMLCVAGTSIFLYGILSIYNKVRDGFIAQTPIPPEGEEPLNVPNDLTEAVKTFVEKTRWD